MTTSPIIHHYPQSPASEKARAFIGLKGIAWRSVIIPRIPPKPKLMPLTGGFRLTPVMQIGADIYCDTFCIIQELENRYPVPSLLPTSGSSADWTIGDWDDTQLFKTAIATVFSDGLDHMPDGFAEDRISLYFNGADQNTYFKDKLSENLATIRSFFGEIEASVSNQDYIGGTSPSVSDALAYYIAWFLRGRFSGGPELIASFPKLESWETRISDIGHGLQTDYEEDAALQDALTASPDAGVGISAVDDLGFEIGQLISVRPSDDENTSTGELISLTDDRVSLLRNDPQVGEIAVHFPRTGYVIKSV